MNNTTNIIVSVVLISGAAFLGLKIIKKLKRPKLGSPCKIEGNPNGTVVYMLDGNQGEGYYCRRCNPTGCASYKY